MTEEIAPFDLAPFEGKALWIHNKSIFVKFYPITDKITEDDLWEMVSEKDRNGDDYEISILKITKEDFFDRFNLKIDCPHDFIIMRVYKVDDGEWIEWEIPEDKDKVKARFTKIMNADTMAKKLKAKAN